MITPHETLIATAAVLRLHEHVRWKWLPLAGSTVYGPKGNTGDLRQPSGELELEFVQQYGPIPLSPNIRREGGVTGVEWVLSKRYAMTFPPHFVGIISNLLAFSTHHNLVRILGPPLLPSALPFGRESV